MMSLQRKPNRFEELSVETGVLAFGVSGRYALLRESAARMCRSEVWVSIGQRSRKSAATPVDAKIVNAGILIDTYFISTTILPADPLLTTHQSYILNARPSSPSLPNTLEEPQLPRPPPHSISAYPSPRQGGRSSRPRSRTRLPPGWYRPVRRRAWTCLSSCGSSRGGMCRPLDEVSGGGRTGVAG